ncbi:Na+/H+ antiporter subunit A [Labedella endophytica]|uniref:Na+/H+ antiporter subunit A n=2 Tax=Labedella endophytica TaxID=1523160 RepID=A0A433JQY7_9MICO|nr:Na+/H+ antiporter subunit A [Labedella endophytica]
MTVLFAVLSFAAPAIVRLLGRRAFFVLAAVPVVAFVHTLVATPVILQAGGSVDESFAWIPQLEIVLSFRMDALAWLLALVVTGVGALVLVYCASYFSDDEPSLGRFAALLLGFAGTMYGLVTSDDVIVMFMYWEITSVLSYLLIGHYTGRKESRGAALQALLVTTLGGLVMLVGVVILSVEAGTTRISELVAAPPEGVGPSIAIVLVLVGAMSKSAIVPFHFWLPAAMAAPTPVSAYLHAAAMVKAGIYLVARFAPGYAESPGWIPVVVGFGVFTMLVGAWRSLRQYDLKLVLAYGTVSQLGFLFVIVGFGTRDAALAGATMLLAHAVYKAGLFLTVGIIDHRTGTRDWRKLTGLARAMPVLTVSAVLSTASMAGIIPLIGFVGKEAVFTAFIEAGLEGDVWAWIALVGTAVGSVLTVAYSARFVWGAFANRSVKEPVEIHRDSGLIVAAPALLGLAGVVLGVAVPLLDPLLAAYADTLGEGDYYLALWHGLEPALFLSIAVIAIGLGLFVARRTVARLQARVPDTVDASRGYWTTVNAVDRTAARVTLFAQRGGLPQYLMTIVVVFVLAVGGALIATGTWPTDIRLFDYGLQPVIAACMIVATIMAARARQRMTAVLLAGVTGFGLVALFGLHGAPDLALTQALVELATIVTFILVLRRLPQTIAQHNKPVRKVRRAIVGILFGATMSVVGAVALSSRQAESLAGDLPRLSLEEGHGRNIVNVMLVDIRAWDTMNEIAVLVVVATGIASLLFVSGRSGTPQRIPGARRQRSNRRSVPADVRHRTGLTGSIEVPAAISAGHGGGEASDRTDEESQPVRSQPATDEPKVSRTTTPEERLASGERQSWLLAGRTIRDENRSVLLEILVRLLFHPAIVVSIFLLFTGHNTPGGGFAGGLLAGLALVARYLAGGRYELAEAVPIDAGKLLGTGILLAVGTAAASLFFGADALTSAYLETDVPVIGHLSIGTSTIFDIGVYLVVVGLTVDILRSLGGEIDRQQEDAELDLDPEAEDDFTTTEASR